MSCGKHLAVPCAHKKLNKCHSSHIKVQNVTKDRLGALRQSSCSVLWSLSVAARGNLQQGLRPTVLASHTVQAGERDYTYDDVGQRQLRANQVFQRHLFSAGKSQC